MSYCIIADVLPVIKSNKLLNLILLLYILNIIKRKSIFIFAKEQKPNEIKARTLIILHVIFSLVVSVSVSGSAMTCCPARIIHNTCESSSLQVREVRELSNVSINMVL